MTEVELFDPQETDSWSICGRTWLVDWSYLRGFPDVEGELGVTSCLVPGSQGFRDLITQGVCEEDEVDGDLGEDECGLEHDQNLLQTGFGTAGDKGQIQNSISAWTGCEADAAVVVVAKREVAYFVRTRKNLSC